MTIQKLKGVNKRTGRCPLLIKGEMTIYQAQELKTSLHSFINNYKKFELDLSQVSEIDSSGMQLLLLFRKKATQANGSIKLLACSEAVSNLITLFGMQDWFGLIDNPRTEACQHN